MSKALGSIPSFGVKECSCTHMHMSAHRHTHASITHKHMSKAEETDGLNLPTLVSDEGKSFHAFR